MDHPAPSPRRGVAPEGEGGAVESRTSFEKGVIKSLNSQNCHRCLLEFWPDCLHRCSKRWTFKPVSLSRYGIAQTKMKSLLFMCKCSKGILAWTFKSLIYPFLLSIGSRPTKSLHTCHLQCLWVEVKFYLRDAPNILQGSDYRGAVFFTTVRLGSLKKKKKIDLKKYYWSRGMWKIKGIDYQPGLPGRFCCHWASDPGVFGAGYDGWLIRDQMEFEWLRATLVAIRLSDSKTHTNKKSGTALAAWHTEGEQAFGDCDLTCLDSGR